ncbi:MAG: HAMP domain-containing sensor histidine kinase [Gemmatimonadales bacterium]
MTDPVNDLSPPPAPLPSTPRLALPWRLAALTGLLALALVVGATEIAFRLAERTRRADLLTESIDLANTLAAYLTRLAPTGEPSALAVGLAGWNRRHITETSAVVYLRDTSGIEGSIGSDSSVGRMPDLADSTARDTRKVLARFIPGEYPELQVAVPLGGPHAWGVLDVRVATGRLDAWARAERRRSYLLGIGVAVLIAAGTWGLVNWWVGRPLGAIIQAMAGAHAGASAAPPAPETGVKEFRHLARRYNLLRTALADRERESEARAALLTLEERARSYDRLALAEETSAGFAHEIGTPLSTMNGHLQLLREDLRRMPGATAANERVLLLLTQVDRVTRIVRAGMSRGSWPTPTARPADLGTLARALVRFLEPALVHARVTATALPADPRAPALVLTTDSDLVEQILLNLLKNAIEAVPPGGHVHLRWGRDAERPYLDVADDGPGLAPEVQAQLFQPFVTSKGSGGTGLGLAVSRRLAHALGGELVYLPGESGARWRLWFSLESNA